MRACNCRPRLEDASVFEPGDLTIADDDRLCPQCGYDLRGIASERCPECGLTVDRNAARTSRIPWTHRRERGRVRAYAATVWMVLRRPRQLLNEAGWPMSYRDARRFWVVTAAIVYLPMLAIAAGVFAAAMSGAMQPWASVVNAPAKWLLALQWDIGLPTLAGWMFTPMIAVLVGAATLNLGAALPWLMNRPTLPTPHRARAVALSYYAAAPAVLLPLAIVAAAALAFLMWAWDAFRRPNFDEWAWVALIGATATILVVLFFAWLRAVGFYVKLGRGGIGRWIAGTALVPAVWAAVVVFWLAAVPWAVGACWLLWRGLR